MDKLNWGILSTGRIATEFAKGLAESGTGHLAAVASRDLAKAQAFTAEYGGRAFGTYDALLADPDVDVVYIATPHPMHKDGVIAAAKAGKHILCEKPIGMNALETKTMIDVARTHGVFLMEAFMYRCHPQVETIRELITTGALGDIKLVQASFGFRAAYHPEGRLFAPELGGGGILDIGCYPVSFSRMVAGAATGVRFRDPTRIEAVGHIGKTGVDELASAIMVFPGGLQSQVSCGINVFQDNHARVYGTNGWLDIPWPWAPAKFGGDWEVRWHRPVRGGEETVEVIRKTETRPLYTVEADTVATAISAGRHEAEAMSWEDSLGNMQTLDRWRQSVGLRYPSERVD